MLIMFLATHLLRSYNFLMLHGWQLLICRFAQARWIDVYLEIEVLMPVSSWHQRLGLETVWV
jgi:hypothetical protein